MRGEKMRKRGSFSWVGITMALFCQVISPAARLVLWSNHQIGYGVPRLNTGRCGLELTMIFQSVAQVCSLSICFPQPIEFFRFSGN